MQKTQYLQLILLIISYISISTANLSSRNLEVAKTYLQFIKAYDLIFQESKWKFNIAYASDTTLSEGTKLTTPILYKGSSSKANCEVKSNEKLECALEQAGQSNSDLVQISNEGDSDADINWRSGLTENFNIPINATLDFVDSYELKYTSSSYNWAFKVEIGADDTLPENGAVVIDLSLTDSKKESATCIHNAHYLSCNFKWQRSNTYLIKIASKKYGSITWRNFNAIEADMMIIPFKSKITIYNEVYNLYLNEDHWEYTLTARIEESIGGISNAFTINTKIVKKVDNTPQYYYTRCYSKEDKSTSSSYNCKVYGNPQIITDLVFLSNKMDVNHISIDWNGKLNNDEIISRNAILSFKRIYDLTFIDRIWNFKIDVENDEDLPENAKVRVDVLTTANNGNIYKGCSFQSHVLTCNEKYSYEPDSGTLILFQSVKSKGSVFWTNLKEKHIYIPLKADLTYQRTFGAIFTNKWNFMLLTKESSDYPSNSKVLIDITHNGQEATALFTRVKENYLYCFSNYQSQAIGDTIKIISTKKNGSVNWKTTFTEVSLVESLFVESETQMSFVDAYNLNFANNKWEFNIIARSNNPNREKKYKVDYFVKKNSGEKEPYTANCLLYIITNNPETRLVCSTTHNAQSKDDLITLAYPKHDISSTSIKWTNTISNDYPITLNTQLTYGNTIDNYVKNSGYWNFDLHLVQNDNYILPLNSKLIVDVSASGSTKTANCTASTKILLSCISQRSDFSQPTITLELIKSLDSSILWENEIEVPAKITPTPEPDSLESPEANNSDTSLDSGEKGDNGGNKKNDSSNIYTNIKFYLLLIFILI